MTKEELAEKLNGTEYGNDPFDAFSSDAHDNKLVMIYGASDDLLEFDGAIYDEAGAWGGTVAYLQGGAVFRECDDPCDHCYMSEEDPANAADAVVTAHWQHEGYAWYIEADVPFAPFEVLDEGEKYCRGIVIDLKDLKRG